MDKVSSVPVLSDSILTTKLYIPSPRANTVIRPRLIGQLNEGLLQNGNFGRKMTLLSAPAGFGKTTLVSEWVVELRQHERSGTLDQVAWLSLDEGDHDPAIFLKYLVASLQTISKDCGQGIVAAIHTSQVADITSLNPC